MVFWAFQTILCAMFGLLDESYTSLWDAKFKHVFYVMAVSIA